MSSEWDAIVGIPVDDWMRADTAEQIEWLAWLRDNPLPLPPDPPCTCPPPSIAVPEFGARFVPMIRGYSDYNPDCVKHRRVSR